MAENDPAENDPFHRALSDSDRFQRTMERLMTGWSDFFWNAFTALKVNGISGDYVEFGSLSGTTLWLAHQQMIESGTPRHLWTFDSFEGYPDTDDPRDEHPAFKGSGGGGLDAFHAACERNGVPRDAYTAVEGYYEETLPALGTNAPPNDIALVYLDCNLYSSTVTALEFLAPRLKHGMIIAYDDWFCWSDARVSGERLATDEFLHAHPEWNFHRFRDVNWGGLSFVVEHADALQRPELGD